MVDNERLRFLNAHERTVFERLFKWWMTGGAAFDVQAASATGDIVLSAYNTQIDVDTTGGNVTLTLPDVAKSIGRRIEITKTVAANTLTVGSADLINGSATLAWTTQWQGYSLISTGVTWRIV